MYRALHLFGSDNASKARDALEPHAAAIVPALEAFSDAARHRDRGSRPSVNVSPAAHFMQAYAVVHRATAGSRSRRARDHERILVDAFRVSGALLDQEVPFSWPALLPGREERLTRPLAPATLLLVDDAARRLTEDLRQRRRVRA